MSVANAAAKDELLNAVSKASLAKSDPSVAVIIETLDND